MRTRASESSDAQAPFFGVRTILVPPDIVAVPRRSPAPVRKRTPWHPVADGQVRTERAGAREWFSDRLFVEGASDHQRSGFSASAVIHVCGAIVVAGSVVAQTVHVPIVRASSSPLTMPHIMATTVVPAVPRPQPPAAPTQRVSVDRKLIPEPPARAGVDELAAAPIEAPSSIEPETGAEGAEPGRVDGAPQGVADGAPAAEATAGSDPSGPYRVGATIKPPRKIRDVKPAYPLNALALRTHGNVVIEATIGVDGKVERATVVHSIASLDQAALDAVRQWEYAPSILNGVAVAVVMMIVVNFTIQ